MATLAHLQTSHATIAPKLRIFPAIIFCPSNNCSETAHLSCDYFLSVSIVLCP